MPKCKCLIKTELRLNCFSVTKDGMQLKFAGNFYKSHKASLRTCQHGFKSSRKRFNMAEIYSFTQNLIKNQTLIRKNQTLRKWKPQETQAAIACVSCGFHLRNVRNASDCVWMETGLHFCSEMYRWTSNSFSTDLITRLTRSAWVACSARSVCLFVCLSVWCFFFRRITKDPKVFKLGTGNGLDISQKQYGLGVEKVKVTLRGSISAFFTLLSVA